MKTNIKDSRPIELILTKSGEGLIDRKEENALSLDRELVESVNSNELNNLYTIPANLHENPIRPEAGR